jgi:hypothetical protein
MTLHRLYTLECDGCGESIEMQPANPRRSIEGWQNGQQFTPLTQPHNRRKECAYDLCPECSDELVVTHCGIIRERLHRKAGAVA